MSLAAHTFPSGKSRAPDSATQRRLQERYEIHRHVTREFTLKAALSLTTFRLGVWALCFRSRRLGPPEGDRRTSLGLSGRPPRTRRVGRIGNQYNYPLSLPSSSSSHPFLSLPLLIHCPRHRSLPSKHPLTSPIHPGRISFPSLSLPFAPPCSSSNASSSRSSSTPAVRQSSQLSPLVYPLSLFPCVSPSLY